jgi:hypothetical protein
MVYGAATYLLQRSADMSISAEQIAVWEAPLKHAEALIPGYLEPTKYLAVAYVNHWQNLSAAQRPEAKEILRRAFHDQQTFNLVIELWLRLVPDRREALSIIPDESFAWSKLERIFQRQKQWNLYLDARIRQLELSDRRINDLLQEAEARVAGGDYKVGTSLFHQVAGLLRPDIANLDEMRRVLDGMPAGPVSRGAARNLRLWLDWTLRLAFLRDNPLDSRQLRRLVGSVPDSSVAEEALAAVLVGDLAAGERIERRHQGGFDETWGPFLTLKAAALLDRGETNEARLAILRVRDAWGTHPTYLALRAVIAEEVARTTETLRTDRWRGSRMSWRQGTAHAEVIPSIDGLGLAIEFLEVPAEGQPVEVAWNGRSVGTYLGFPDRPVEVKVEISTEPSLLEIRALDRRLFAPGLIRVLAAP